MERSRYFPGIWGAIAILACLLALEILVASAFYDFGHFFSYGDPRLSIASVIAHGIFFCIFMGVSGIKYKNIFHPSNSSLSSTLTTTTFPLTIIVVSSFWWLGDLEYWITLFFEPDHASIEALNTMLESGIISIIVVSIIAPFLEEMLFRGIILRGFLMCYSPMNAILVSSALFGLIHLNIYQVPGAFIFGCLLGWVFYLSHSIWPCIFAHSLWNTLVYFYYHENPELYRLDAEVQFNSVLVNLGTFVITLLGLYLLFRRFRVVNVPNKSFKRD